ncbi:MAG TPA: hypothetical protein VIV58_20525, partial [Kofleriaceae bacterium]
KAVAQFVYAYLLDATEELQDAADTAKQQLAAAKDAQRKIDERMEYDKAHPNEPKSTAKKKEEAAWVAAVQRVRDARIPGTARAIAKSAIPGNIPVDPAALQLEAEATEARGKIVAAFENGWHPIHNRALTKKEQHWWSEYDRLGGLAEKGWAEIKEFGEGVLIAFAVGLVTGGLGDLAIGGLEIASSDAMIGWGLQVGDVATAGIKLGEMAAFTESMRIIQDLQTGQGPESSFWEDLGVNVVMAGASKFAAGRMSKALESRNIKLTSLRARASMFVAEYIATSGVGLAHLYISSAFRGDTVTESDVKANLLSNFAFLVGMKATHAFVELPKHVFREEASTWKDPAVAAKYKELGSVLEKYDDEFSKVLPEILKAETPEQRRELLEHQADILEGKAKRIEESGIPDAAEVAKSFRAGVEAFKADAKRATTLEQVKVKGIGDTPNLSYERGSLNEAALESMLRDSESNFKIIEKANGAKVYVVMTAEGAIRYEPREPGTGGSQKEAYSKATRIKGEEIPGKTKGSKEKVESAKDVALILAAATSTRSPLIPPGVGESFALKAAGCNVVFAVADKLSSSADHDAGPATYSLKLNGNGKWEAIITVRKSAPNDHVVRGVNHEVTELNELIQRLEARAKKLPGGRDAYKKPAVLAKAIAAETSERALKDPKKGALSSHDLANLDADVATLEKQIAEAQAAVERLQPGQDRSAAEAR